MGCTQSAHATEKQIPSTLSSATPKRPLPTVATSGSSPVVDSLKSIPSKAEMELDVSISDLHSGGVIDTYRKKCQKNGQFWLTWDTPQFAEDYVSDEEQIYLTTYSFYVKLLTRLPILFKGEGESTIHWDNAKLSTLYKGYRLKFPLRKRYVKGMMRSFRRKEVLHIKYALELIKQATELIDTMIPCNLARITTSPANEQLSKEVTVCVVGDIHGQIDDLITIFEINGFPSSYRRYVFNGDLVDRGSRSIEVVLVLLAFFILFPKSIVINRGNHEDRYINRTSGFFAECSSKYGRQVGPIVFEMVNDLFGKLPSVCLIDNKVMVVHGGIHNSNITLNMIEKCPMGLHPSDPIIKKFEPGSPMELILNLLWCDPNLQPGSSGAIPSPRGAGHLFSADLTESFLKLNNLEHIIRSHQCKAEGYEQHFGGLVYTVFSASNYLPTGNKGAFALYNSSLRPRFVQFLALEASSVVRRMDSDPDFMNAVMSHSLYASDKTDPVLLVGAPHDEDDPAQLVGIHSDSVVKERPYQLSDTTPTQSKNPSPESSPDLRGIDRLLASPLVEIVPFDMESSVESLNLNDSGIWKVDEAAQWSSSIESTAQSGFDVSFHSGLAEPLQGYPLIRKRYNSHTRFQKKVCLVIMLRRVVDCWVEMLKVRLARLIRLKRSTIRSAFLRYDKGTTKSINISKWSLVLEKSFAMDLPWTLLLEDLPLCRNDENNIRYEQFLDWCDVWSKEGLVTTHHLGYDSLYHYRPQLETIFKFFDADDSGFITRSDFVEGCRVLNSALKDESEMVTYDIADTILGLLQKKTISDSCIQQQKKALIDELKEQGDQSPTVNWEDENFFAIDANEWFEGYRRSEVVYRACRKRGALSFPRLSPEKIMYLNNSSTEND